MKKVFKILFLLIAAVVFTPSCDKEVGFNAITSDPDENATYFVQFINASKSYETSVTDAGTLVEVEKPISVVIMGLPQDEAVTANLTVDPATTLASNMYTLSSNTITIPAGKTSGSVTFKTIAANMPVDVPLKLVLTLNAGEHNSPSATATKLTYTVKRFAFCPLNGLADLVGTWTGEDAYYGTGFTTSIDNGKIKVEGMGEAFIEDWWGEQVVAGGSFLMTINGNGTVDIPRQYIFTTVYQGDNYDYEVKGTGKWENCGANPRLIITYDIYYPGDADGLAKTYAGYLDNIPYLTADVTLTGKGMAAAFTKPAFKSPRK